MNHDDDASGESQPIDLLVNLEQEVSPQFLAGVRKKIYRRMAANQMIGFSWNLPKVVLMEMMSLIAHLFSRSRKDNVKP
jgi:hypothetical protein